MSCPDMSVDATDGPDFSRVSYPRSRKPRWCCECGRQIKTTERHQYVVGRWEGYLDTYRTCLRCVAVRLCVTPQAWIYGGLQEAIDEADRVMSKEQRRACQIEIRRARKGLADSFVGGRREVQHGHR